ncbi:restriction endonuclease subunit S [Shigella sonnei]|nr:restriction endonuclease subunit S [Escherichia coli]EEL6549450.1 restriction endonuclease subunit S [Salmonella enterica subsp. enterica serovar Agona]MDD0751302.1 restriction endonuclease subunit S [Shigella sonnei]EFM0432288.1 restriction endonuclease subunit S [Escherichia coli]EFN5818929.1 restriction endonuclease subunit S [Escherichia coli]EFO4331710.1 restriction endonuclease subunit S [Escherichia coli]
MSELSYLEKLLDGVEVEWVTLGSMADIGTGSSNRQDESENGIYPFYVRSKNILKSDTFEFDEVAIVIPGEGGIGDIFHYVEGKYALHQRAYRIRITTNAVDTKFLYYFMSSSFKQYILTKSVGATAISIRKPMLEGFKVPIPSPDNPEKSLAIQSEIVRILDTFTALTAELTAELNMRKKQYNYYRDQLLSFKEGEVEWKALEEVSDIYDSLHQTPQYSKNGLSMIRVTDIKNGYIDLKNTLKVNDGIFSIFTKKYLPQKNDLVMSRVGSYGNVGIIPTDNSACMGQNTVVIHPYINNRYLFYILTSSIGQDFIEKNVGGGSQKTLSLKSIKSIPIPLTGESEQSKIVSILDKFDTLTNSITEGLPREIELRQKQYEYYRDLLFSFPKPETVSN